MNKQLLKSALIAVAGVGLLAGSALATSVNVSESNGEDSLNTIFANQGWTINANTDQASYDKYWQVSEGDSGSFATLVIEIAGFSEVNKFGIFDNAGNELDLMGGGSDPGDRVAIWFSGGKVYGTYFDASASTTSNLTPTTMLSTFGYYIETPNVTFYSDDTKNSDNKDHMVTYFGTKNPYTNYQGNGLTIGHSIIAFEDTSSPNWDWDYNDMVLKLESVNPIPEPTTMLLFGTGLLGLAAAARRRKNS